MLRKLITGAAGVVFTFLAALPAFADSEQSFQIEGNDLRRGPYTGQLTLTQQDDGSVAARRQIRYARDGEEQVQSGVLEQRGEQLRGVLREATGARGRLQNEATAADLLSVQVDAERGVCAGACVGNTGTSRFQVQAAPAAKDPEPTPAVESADAPSADDAAPERTPTVNERLGEEPAPSPAPRAQQPSGESFAGYPIYDYDPDLGITDVKGAYRVSVNWQNEDEFDALLKKLLDDPNVGKIEALVLGYWGYDATDSIEILTRHADDLAGLKALFVGDIDYDEAEISWIQNSDIGPLINKLPALETLKVRGGNGLGFSGKFKHDKLKSILVESGGTPGSAVRELGNLELPALEKLELWLGTDEYGADSTVADVKGFLEGKNFPKLKYLGLMNSDISDDIAVALKNAPILGQLEVVDLSMGTLSDRGAQALLENSKIKALKTLNLEHHYMSDAVQQRIEALSPVKVIADESALDPDYPDDRYTAVGE